jgi:hypothetical protein
MEPESFTWLTATLPNGECGGQLGLLAQTLESDRRPSGRHCDARSGTSATPEARRARAVTRHRLRVHPITPTSVCVPASETPALATRITPLGRWNTLGRWDDTASSSSAEVSVAFRMLSTVTTTSRRIVGSTEFDGFAIRVRHYETALSRGLPLRLVR